MVVENRPHDQVVVKVDGSRWLMLRNRRFIRELNPRKTCLEDQFVIQERRRSPEGPWRRLTPSLPKKIEVVKNQSMATDVIITPVPVDTALQIEDDKGDGQRMVANVTRHHLVIVYLHYTM